MFAIIGNQNINYRLLTLDRAVSLRDLFSNNIEVNR